MPADVLKSAAMAIEDLREHLHAVRARPGLTEREKADAAKSIAQGIAAIVKASQEPDGEARSG